MSKTINDLFTQAKSLSETLIDLNPLLQTPAAQGITSQLKEMTQRELTFAQQQMSRAQEHLEAVKGELATHQGAAKAIFESGLNAQREMLTDMSRRALQVAEESMGHMGELTQAQIDLAKSIAEGRTEVTQRVQGAVKEAAWGALSALVGLKPAPQADEAADAQAEEGAEEGADASSGSPGAGQGGREG